MGAPSTPAVECDYWQRRAVQGNPHLTLPPCWSFMCGYSARNAGGGGAGTGSYLRKPVNHGPEAKVSWHEDHRLDAESTTP